MENMAQSQAFEQNNLLLLTILLLPLVYLIFKWYSSKSLPLPPGPFSWPILGNILQMNNQHHIYLTKFAQTYGPLFSLRIGNQLVVVASSKEAAIEILKTNSRILAGRVVPHSVPAKSKELNNLSLVWVAECNNSWKFMRKICQTEIFSGKAIDSQAYIRENKGMEMVRFLRKMEGEVVKIRGIAFNVVLNMLSNILFSRDLASLDHKSDGDGEIGEVVEAIMDMVNDANISDIYPILGGLDLQGMRKKSLYLHDRISSVLKPIVKQRREEKLSGAAVSSQPDVLDAMLENDCTDDQIYMLFREFLIVATDPSKATVEWTLSELVKNPEYMKRAKEELAREFKGNDVITESKVAKLQFLQACVKESLRLHAPTPLHLPRRALESCEIMNYSIPKNTQLIINYYAIGRDPKYWEEPLRYKPERFLKPEGNLDFKGADFEFIPFGSGMRICPGMPMAAKHIPMILAHMIHFFNWSLPEGMSPGDLDMSDKFALTLLKKQPLLVIPQAEK